MAAKKKEPTIPTGVQAFGETLTAARHDPIEIPGVHPPVLGRLRRKEDLSPPGKGEIFPDLRTNHSYVFELPDGPLYLAIELFKNNRDHWRLFAFCERRGLGGFGDSVFSLNLTLADDGGPGLALQQRLKITTQSMTSGERLEAATSLAERLSRLGLDVSEDRDIRFPDFDARSRSFEHATAAAFIRDFVITAVWKGHYMMNKGYALQALDAESDAEPFPGRSGSHRQHVTAVASIAEQGSAFDPNNFDDTPKVALAEVVHRPAQAAFRRSLLRAYEGRCAVTGCNVTQVLTAAHIMPHRGDHTDVEENGLLLRADLHLLFDAKLLAVDSTTMRIVLAPMLKGTVYEELAGTTIARPTDPRRAPNRAALDRHRKEAGL